MILPEIPFAVRASGETVSVEPSFALITGNTGSGKTTAAKAILSGYASLGDAYQAVVFNPKIVGWKDAEPRFHVLVHEEDWLQAVVALNDEVELRYQRMAESGVEDFEPSGDVPYVLLVLEETPSIIGSSAQLVKREADEMRAQLLRLSRTARQAGMGVFAISQTAFTESVPSGLRSNLFQRIVLRAGSAEEAEVATGRPSSEVSATMLLPGECQAMTAFTAQRYVRCRAFSPKFVGFGDVMSAHASDKRPLGFLEGRGITS